MNDNNSKVNVNIGGGFLGLLTLLFITLKLCGVIAWSWWWVLAPLWMSWGIAIIGIVIVFITTFIFTAIDKKIK